MAGRHFLQIPGPTPIPDRLLRAMHRASEDHRSSAFPTLTRSILSRLPAIVNQTHGEHFVFPSSGTGMWEAALVNTQQSGRVCWPSGTANFRISSLPPHARSATRWM